MYKAVKKAKAVGRYTEALSLHTVAPAVNLEDNTGCIYVVES